MNTANLRALPAPPSLTRSLLAGFDIIGNHIGLIAFSVSLDLFLWFGPHLQLRKLVEDIFRATQTLPETQTAEIADMLASSQAMWQLLAERYNLFSALKTLPVGIPSLMAGRAPVQTPLGMASIWQSSSIGVTILLWLALFGLGVLVSTLYFGLVAQASSQEKVDFPLALRQWRWQVNQVFALTAFWLFIILIFGLPLACLLTVTLAGGIAASRIVILVYAGLVLWVIFPLFFTPHGIFVNHSPLLISVKQSIGLTRWTLPTTALFVLTALILNQGLRLLWELPAETSWLALVGIIGHAFIGAGLLAASFVYYRDAQRFVREKSQVLVGS